VGLGGGRTLNRCCHQPWPWSSGNAIDAFATPSGRSRLAAYDEGNAATWGDHVTDEQYEAAPPIDG